MREQSKLATNTSPNVESSWHCFKDTTGFLQVFQIAFGCFLGGFVEHCARWPQMLPRFATIAHVRQTDLKCINHDS